MVRFKLKSDPSYTEHAVDDGSTTIPVAALKAVITEAFSLQAFGLKLSNADTKQEYPDGGADIPADASILVKRVPLTQSNAGSIGFGGEHYCKTAKS